MNNLINTSKKLDIFFKILGIAVSIGLVTCIVALGIVAVGFLFDLDPEMIGTGYNELELGDLSLRLAEDQVPNKDLLLITAAIETAMALAVAIICRLGIRCIRGILRPMTEGAPFHSGISAGLKKLALYSLILGIAVNALQVISTMLWISHYDLEALLTGDKITHVTFNLSFDLTFLVVAAVLFLLSHVFRYGEELQQLEDETL